MLARRLINQQSVSIDSEEFMVTKLKVNLFEKKKTLFFVYSIKANMWL